MNKLRHGEEYEIKNMIDYLSNTTVKEWRTFIKIARVISNHLLKNFGNKYLT